MFEILPESKNAMLAIRASGKLTTTDYETLLLPRLNELFKEHAKLRILVEFADDFSCWASPGAAWDDMKIGLQHPNDFEKIAFVNAPDWIMWGMKFYSLFVSGDVKSFSTKEYQEAFDWLESEAK